MGDCAFLPVAANVPAFAILSASSCGTASGLKLRTLLLVSIASKSSIEISPLFVLKYKIKNGSTCFVGAVLYKQMSAAFDCYVSAVFGQMFS